MSYDPLDQVPTAWLEVHIEKLAVVYEKTKHLYWVRWEGGYKWKWGVKRPKQTGSFAEWEHPTFAQLIQRAAILAGVHKTTRDPEIEEWKYKRIKPTRTKIFLKTIIPSITDIGTLSMERLRALTSRGGLVTSKDTADVEKSVDAMQ